MTARKFGGQTWYFGKNYFFGTHPHVLIEAASETRSRTVFFLLLSITDLWTPRNVPLTILTPPPVKKIVPARLRDHDQDPVPLVDDVFLIIV